MKIIENVRYLVAKFMGGRANIYNPIVEVIRNIVSKMRYRALKRARNRVKRAQRRINTKRCYTLKRARNRKNTKGASAKKNVPGRHI